MIWKIFHKRIPLIFSIRPWKIHWYFSPISLSHCRDTLVSPQTNSPQLKNYTEEGKEKGRKRERGRNRIDWNSMKLLISISAIFKCFSKLPYRNGICIAFTFHAARYRDYTVTYEVITEFWKRKTQRKRNIIRSIVFTARNSIPIDIGIILKYFSTHEKYTFL